MSERDWSELDEDVLEDELTEDDEAVLSAFDDPETLDLEGGDEDDL